MRRSALEALKSEYPMGCRVKLIHMNDFQAPPAGTLGTVRFVDDMGSIHVSWDRGGSLALIAGEDMWEKI